MESSFPKRAHRIDSRQILFTSPAKPYLSAIFVQVPVVREAILDTVPADLPVDYHGVTSVDSILSRRTSQLSLAVFLTGNLSHVTNRWLLWATNF